MPDNTRVDTFADIVAGLDEQVSCDSVYPCSKEAASWADIHGCVRAAVCTTHVMQWVEDSSLRIAHNGYVRCRHCGGIFDAVDQLGTFRPL